MKAREGKHSFWDNLIPLKGGLSGPQLAGWTPGAVQMKYSRGRTSAVQWALVKSLRRRGKYFNVPGFELRPPATAPIPTAQTASRALGGRDTQAQFP